MRQLGMSAAYLHAFRRSQSALLIVAAKANEVVGAGIDLREIPMTVFLAARW